MQPPVPESLAFDDVVIDFVGRRVTRGGAEQGLEPKAFSVLALLVGSPGRAFTRDELLDAVWGHRHVTQSVLNRILSLLRQALGEDAQDPRRLHTVHGIGYRFDLPPTEPLRKRGLLPAAIVFVVVAVLLLVAFAGVAWLGREEDAARTIPADASATSRPSLAVL